MGLYTIITRATGTVLTGFGSTSDIYNFDHENHVLHTEPESINSAEATLTDMQAAVDPGPGGVVSLPDSMTAEVRRIRFALAQVKQALTAAVTPPQWYTPIAGTSAGVFLPPTAVRRELTLPVSIPSGSETLCPFNQQIYNFGFPISTGSGTIVPVTGIYLAGASVGLGAPASLPTGVFRVMLTRDPQGAVARTNFAARTIDTSTTAAERINVVESIVRLTAGDTFNVWVFHTSGIGRPLAVDATIHPAMWLALVGR